MGWFFAAVVLVIFIWLLIAFPAFRIGVLVVVGGGGLLLYQLWSTQNDRQQKRDAVAMSLIQPSQLTFSRLTLRPEWPGTWEYWKVAGTVTNNSNATLSDFFLRVKVQDCPQGEACVTIGQEDVSVYGVKVPPGQLRAFENSVTLRNMPKPQNLSWGYELLHVKADVP